MPFFESKVSSAKSYWLKAVAKALKEELGIAAKLTKETAQTRKVRWLTEKVD